MARTGSLASGSHISYWASLQRGTWYEVMLNQPDDDLTLEVLRPDGRRLDMMDAFPFGEERLVINPSENGLYEIRVGDVSVKSRYRVSISAGRTSPPHDAAWLEAERLTASAKEDSNTRTRPAQQAAADKAQQAATLWEAMGDLPSEIRSLLMAGTALQKLSKASEARDLFRQADEIARPLNDARTLAEILNDAGVCSWQLGETIEARTELLGAIRQWDRAQFEFGKAASLENLGLVAWQTGHLGESILNHDQALPVFKRYGATEAVGLTLNNLALAYAAEGNFRLALNNLNSALGLLKADDKTAVARVWVNIASVDIQGGKWPDAAKAAQTGLSKLLSDQDPRALGEARTILGRVSIENSRPSEAIDYLTQAGVEFSRAQDRRGEASSKHHLGVALAHLGRVDEALDHLEGALRIRNELGIYDMAAESLFEIAQIETQRGNLPAASSRMDEALSLIESIRTQVAGDQFRAFYVAARYRYYELQIDLLARLKLEAAAFDVSERSRARSLLDLLGEERAAPVGIPAELRSKEEQLQQQLNLNARILVEAAADKDHSRTDRIRDEIEVLTAQFDETEEEIRNASPGFDTGNAKPLTLSQVQQIIGEDTTLLEFALGKERSYLWVITDRSQKLLDIGPRSAIENLSRTVLRILRTPPDLRPPHDTSALLNYAIAQLSSLLLKQASPLMRTPRVALVTDGILQYLPFAALTDPARPGRYFGEDRELVTLPSASTLGPLRRRRSSGGPAQKIAAIFADPVFGYPDKRLVDALAERGITKRESSGAGVHYPQLAYSGDEARAIAAAVGSSAFRMAVGFDATKAALKSLRLAEYRIVHFSTHATIDDESPLLSALILSLVNKRGEPLDGILRVHEVYGLDFRNTDFVMLSACKTGLGREVTGEGFLGFTRAFLYAGARRMGITFWEIDDQASAALNGAFYRNMLGTARMSPALALAKAQATIRGRANWKDPYFWAGVTLVGDWGP
jgi:CHAT domain-containing protein